MSDALRPSSPARAARRDGAGLLPLLLALASVAAAADARGEEGGPLLSRRPTAVRAGLLYYVGGVALPGEKGAPSDGLVGVTVARQVSPALALEGTFGAGPEGDDVAPHLGAGARVTVFEVGHGAASLGLGAHLGFRRRFGTVAVGHLEAAWQMRRDSGFDLVAGGGLAMPLWGSRRDPERCASDDGYCVDRFRGGAVGPWLNVTAGFAF